MINKYEIYTKIKNKMMGPTTYMPSELSHKQRTQLISYHNSLENELKIPIEPINKCYNCIIN